MHWQQARDRTCAPVVTRAAAGAVPDPPWAVPQEDPGSSFCRLYFVEEANEAQRGGVSYPRSHSGGFESGSQTLRGLVSRLL